MKIKTITICCSASFVKKAFEIANVLKEKGYNVLLPKTAYKMKREKDFNVNHYKTWYKNPNDYKIKNGLINDHFEKVIRGDAILIVNDKKRGLKGYIGGNTLMEITIAYFHKKPIFILNQIADELSFKEEILGINPIFLNGKIKDFNY
jgi:hypothetical protein